METFVGRARELERLESNVMAGRSCMISAGRRTGKTMLLRALRERLRATGVEAIYVDAHAVRGPVAAADFVRLVANESSPTAHDGTLERTLEAAATSVIDDGHKWCLIVDEIEVLARSRDGAAVLDNLRHVVSNSPVAGDACVVISGGPDLTIQLRSSGSSLANVCTPVELLPFLKADVAALVDLGVREPDRLRVTMYLWLEAGGHPYVAQALLESMPDQVPAEIEPALIKARTDVVHRLGPQVEGMDPLLLGAARSLVSGQQPAPHERIGLLTSGLARAEGKRLAINGRVVADALAEARVADIANAALRDPEWLAAILAQGETSTVEFKESIRWDVQRATGNELLKYEITETIAGFMNGEGGTIVLGVTAAGEAIGLARDLANIRRNPTLDGATLLVGNLLRDTLGGAAAGSVRFASAGTPTAPVLILTVDAAPRPIFADVRGAVHFYRRIGTSTIDFDPRETLEYVLQRWLGIDRI